MPTLPRARFGPPPGQPRESRPERSYVNGFENGMLLEPIPSTPTAAVRVEHVLRPVGSAAPHSLPHCHEPAELIWFRKANGEVATEFGLLPIRSGTLLFLPSMAIHDIRLNAGATAWVAVHFDPTIAQDIAAAARWHCPLPGEERARVTTALAGLTRLAASPDRSADMAVLIRQLLAGMPPPGAAAHQDRTGAALQRLRPALDMVATASDRLVGMEEAAARCSLSPSRFSHAFSHAFGIGFAEYARQYRLQAAARSLTTSALPVSEIADQSGFPNPSHFASAFLRRFGVSPSQFRRLHQARA